MILHPLYLLIKSQYLFIKNMSSQRQIWSSNLDNAYDQGKKTHWILSPGVNSLLCIYIMLFSKPVKWHSVIEPQWFFCIKSSNYPYQVNQVPNKWDDLSLISMIKTFNVFIKVSASIFKCFFDSRSILFITHSNTFFIYSNEFSCNFTAVKLQVIQSLVSQFITPLEPMISSVNLKFTFFAASNDSPGNEQNSLCGFIPRRNTFWKNLIPDIWT